MMPLQPGRAYAAAYRYVSVPFSIHEQPTTLSYCQTTADSSDLLGAQTYAAMPPGNKTIRGRSGYAT